MAGAKRFLSTVVTSASGSNGEGIWQNTTGKPLSVTLGAQAISTDRDACMSMSVGIGSTAFTTRIGIASGNFEDYFGMTGPGANPTGFNTTFGTFFLGQDCNCPGGSYCASTAGIATFIAADGTETKNWQGGHNIWGCCICLCAGPYPDTSCSSWCANTFWGGQEQINFALSFYHEYTGLCWDRVEPYKSYSNMNDCASVHPLGWTMMGTCMYGPCRSEPPHSWVIHECHGQDPTKASQTWINHYCCCGRCNYENNSIGTMGICYGYNNYNCGGFYNWYALTNNQPDVVCKLWCCDGGCNMCMCGNACDHYCYTQKCPDHHHPGDMETYLTYNCRAGHSYCICFCCQCGRFCRDRRGACCISSFTDCYSDLCRFCCWPHWSEGWTCQDGNCPMNPYGGVAGAGTQCGIVRHHKTMGTCQMYFIGIHYACSWYCQRCSCGQQTLDLWINPPKYGTTNCCTNEYSIKYMSWNPQKCCTYLAIRSKVDEQCGIFSWFGSGQLNEYREWQLGTQNWYCIWPCDTTYFKKVADFPSTWVSDEKYFSPIMCTTCIHRVEKCLWAIGVYNCTDKRFDPFLSSDLINWNPSPKGNVCTSTIVCDAPGNCIVEYMSTTCKWRVCTSFDNLVCQEGILDWKLKFNNYERTGVIIDCDARLFVDNIQNSTAGLGTDFSLQIWGYEG